MHLENRRQNIFRPLNQRVTEKPALRTRHLAPHHWVWHRPCKPTQRSRPINGRHWEKRNVGIRNLRNQPPRP
jgi:hypothetical protein